MHLRKHEVQTKIFCSAWDISFSIPHLSVKMRIEYLTNAGRASNLAAEILNDVYLCATK